MFKLIKFYAKATGVALSAMALLWFSAMFVTLRPIKFWRDEGDRICTATLGANGQLSANWAYGVHDYAVLRALMVMVLIITLIVATIIRANSSR